MKRMLALLPLVLAACQSKPEKLPEEQMTVVEHKEYERFRPVTLAVLKAEAPAARMRTRARLVLHDQLLEVRHYSPIALEVVDARTNSNGVFEPGADLDCDATVKLKVTGWRSLRGHNLYACDAELVMTHETGVELYRCTMKDGLIKSGLDVDYMAVSNQIVEKLIDKLPNLPPLPE